MRVDFKRILPFAFLTAAVAAGDLAKFKISNHRILIEFSLLF